MQIKLLDAKNPNYNADRWLRLRALAKGGECFREYLNEFLPQNPMEPLDRYRARCREAHYTSYLGAIVNLYASWLFSANFSIAPYDKEKKKLDDKFYGAFVEDVGNKTKLTDFMRDRFREAMRTHKAIWLLEKPSDGGQPPQSKAEVEERGLDRVYLCDVDACDVYDWECDDEGRLSWVLIHTKTATRANWKDPRSKIVETWRVYDDNDVTTFQISYEQGNRPPIDSNIEGTAAPHGFKRVPIVVMHFPHELAVGEQVADAQLEHFRLSAGMSWAIRQTCYAVPVLNLENDDSAPSTMGTGYWLKLGEKDKFGWSSPPTAPFDVLQKNIDAKRNEIYRVVHQMAQGLDNNAETVGRSAESKEIDAAATRILLNAYGAYVSRYIEETLRLVSEARGDDYEWSVEGFSGYDTATAASLLANIRTVKEIGIPSETFEKVIATKGAMSIIPEVDHRVKDQIRQEIEAWKFPVTDKTVEEVKMELMASKAEANKAKAKLDESNAAESKSQNPSP